MPGRSICMALFLLISLSFAAAGPLFVRQVAPDGDFTGCGTNVTEADVLAAEREFTQHKENLFSDSSLDDLGLGPIAIDVYWHIVAANATLEGGWANFDEEGSEIIICRGLTLRNEQIDAQMEVLNKDYQDAGVTFKHINTTRIVSPEWFEKVKQGSQGADAMKTIFRKGGADSLNVWTVGFPQSGLLGYATFPWTYRREPEIDGVIIRYSTLPGGVAPKHEGGRTLTHEAGHWLGLYHTFQARANPGTTKINF
ncbi:hypothetical protein H0H81_001872 [Sphagnurus paluster]|uniref:Peptidase M43 pregnancy-associated plasma-A domain-containing protein n=1 Tax=Sphagnurus paluster TaxID=117069 RepID=A0A9P7FMF0_9AGAR|nr:hypothetical protein H0H81_001872 [Sphagnurus paluster]